MVSFNNDWDELLKNEFTKDYYLKLRQTLINEYRTQRIFPNMYDIYNAMKYTSYNDVRCVIIGQDPYHGEGQAHGLSFSVRKGIAPPPSLVNIFKEIKDDIGTVPQIVKGENGKSMYDGSLRRWAEQGVFLLNATLTVREHLAGSHQKQGWETFTDAVISAISQHCQHVVFLLWGGYARSKAKLIDRSRHLVLESVHPSPLSANRGGWFGNHQFSRCNSWLQEQGLTPIVW